MTETNQNAAADPLGTHGSGWQAVFLTAGIIGAVELADRFVIKVPVPIAILQLSAVYTAFVGRTIQGLFSAVLIGLFGIYKFSLPGQLLQYDAAGLWRVGVGFGSPTALVLIVGLLRRRADSAAAALRDRLVLEAQRAERQTSQTRLERQRVEYQTILHSVPAMIWFKDQKNRILRANRQAAESIGKSVEEIEGRLTEELYPSEDAAKYLQDDLEVIQSGKPKLGIIEPYAMVGPERRWVRTDKLPFRDANGTVTGVIVFAVDVTEQVQARDVIQNARNELEQRVHERTEALSRANESLHHEILERERAETSRQLIEHRLQQIIDNTTAVIYAKDEAGKYLFVNRRFEELFHVQRDALAGRTDHELFPKEHADAFRTNDLRVLQSAQAVEFEEIAPHDDGPHHYISLKFPLLDDEGRATAICGISTDITLRKKTEQLLQSSEQQLADLFENAPVGIHVVDRDGYIVRANKAELDLLGYSLEELVGRHVSNYYVDTSVMNDILARLARGETIRQFEAQIRCKDGTVRDVLFDKNVHWQDGQFLHTRCFTTDITDRKKAVESLRDHASRLETTNRELAAARIAAEAANRAKSRFLANISHEVRTPIMAMLAAAELFGQNPPPGESGLNHRDIILRNGRHLLALVDELLDVSRIEAGKLEMRLEECPMLEMVADVVAVTAPIRRDKPVDFRVRFTTEIPTTIRTDRLRVTQALINLVNNANKFTARGHVELRIGLMRTGPSPRMIFEVVDTGVGIRAEDQGRIFESFAQIDPVSRGASAGAGLGLPIAKSIAERLGGSLEVESEFGRGSCFRLTLEPGPLDHAQWLNQGDAESTVRQVLDHSVPFEPAMELRGRVLLAEDADDARDLIREALAQAGADVTTACNGREAVEFAACAAFDLILLDIRMPQLDGLAAAERIRRAGYRLAMVALTASTSGRDRERLLAAGFDDIWAKPIALNRLVEMAGQYLAAADPGAGQRPRVTADRWNAAAAEFRDSVPDRIRVIREAVDSGDTNRACDALHQLIGTSGIHGWSALSDEACRLRASLKAGMPDQTKAHLQRLIEVSEAQPVAQVPLNAGRCGPQKS